MTANPSLVDRDLEERPSAQVDDLTGLWSRAAFLDRLGAALEAGHGASGGPALILVDLDRFSAVNDTRGTEVGDGVLARVAGRLRSGWPGALLARVSGDEFALLVPDRSSVGAATERLRDLVTRPYVISGHVLTLSVSLGVALAPEHGDQANSLLRSASLALHRAKLDGRGGTRTFEPWMEERATHRQALEVDLRTALASGRSTLRRAIGIEQFEVHFQPQVSLAGRRLTGFEALARWQHPQRGMVAPSEFVPVAEEIGLIGFLGEWVLRTACFAAASWPTPRTGRPLKVSVNVSPVQLREPGVLVASVADALARSGLAPDRLELEITESALIGDAEEILRRVKGLGVQLALDDFGTGYSSLSQLGKYPFDRLKIDRSFVSELGLEPANEAQGIQARWMIRAIAALGAGLGMETVAEGVETEVQAVLVEQAGIRDMQGWLVSRAVPADRVPAIIVAFDQTRGEP